MKISIIQINVESGKIKENVIKIEKWISKAMRDSPDLLILPEMVDTGYDMKTIIKKLSQNGLTKITIGLFD